MFDWLPQLIAVVFNSLTAILAYVVLLLGLACLLFGRRLLGVFVALAGFVIALAVAPRFLGPVPDDYRPFIVLASGLVLALVAGFIPRLMTALAGGLLVLASLHLLAQMADFAPALAWAGSGVMGLLAALLVWRFFDWGVILVSAALGGLLMIASLNALVALPFLANETIFGLLALIGLVFQIRDRWRGPLRIEWLERQRVRRAAKHAPLPTSFAVAPLLPEEIEFQPLARPGGQADGLAPIGWERRPDGTYQLTFATGAVLLDTKTYPPQTSAQTVFTDMGRADAPAAMLPNERRLINGLSWDIYQLRQGQLVAYTVALADLESVTYAVRMRASQNAAEEGLTKVLTPALHALQPAVA